MQSFIMRTTKALIRQRGLSPRLALISEGTFSVVAALLLFSGIGVTFAILKPPCSLVLKLSLNFNMSSVRRYRIDAYRGQIKIERKYPILFKHFICPYQSTHRAHNVKATSYQRNATSGRCTTFKQRRINVNATS